MVLRDAPQRGVLPNLDAGTHRALAVQEERERDGQVSTGNKNRKDYQSLFTNIIYGLLVYLLRLWAT